MTRTTIERRALLRLAALAFAPTAAGCSSLIPGSGTPPQLYVLMRKTTFPPDLPSISRQLLVSTPIAPAEIDTTRVALTRSPLSATYCQMISRYWGFWPAGTIRTSPFGDRLVKSVLSTS